MSYILDALKKSEQERGHGNIPDVQTVHSSSLNYRNDKKAYWPYILITAVILNLLAITYFIVNKEKPSTTPLTAQNSPAITQAITENDITSEGADQPTAAPVTVSTDKDIEMNERIPEVTATADNLPAKPATKATAPAETAIPENTGSRTLNNNSGTGIIEYHDLPESIRQQLPAIIISAHVYSSNPSQRSVVINNNFLEEGEYVIDGLILYEITTDGAIFNYQGTLFNYGVVSGWQ